MATSFRDIEVFDIRPHFDGVEPGQLDDLAFDAVGFGPATPWRPSGVLRRTATIPFVIQGVDEIAALRKFWERHRGEQRPFWIPTWTNEYLFAADEDGDDTVTLQGHGYATRHALGDRNRFLIFITRAGLFEPHGVISVSASGDDDALTLDAALTATGLDAGTTLVSPLLLVRFAGDELDMDYLSGDVVQVELEFVELPVEYPEPDPAGNDSALDTAHFGTQPVFLYRFTDLATSTQYRWADYGVDVDLTGDSKLLWTAANITGDDLTATLDMLGDEMEIGIRTDDSSHPLLPFLDPVNMTNMEVEVFLVDLDDVASLDLAAPDHIGRVEEFRMTGRGGISVRVGSVFRFGEMEVPKKRLQRLCDHKTFDGIGCQAVEADFTTAGTVTALNDDPAYVEASEFGAKATAESDADWFALGKVTIGSEIRTCTGASGNRLYLNFPFRNASVSDSVSAVAGDDHRIQTCSAKFDQAVNFLGSPYKPSRNPSFRVLESPKAEGGKK